MRDVLMTAMKEAMKAGDKLKVATIRMVQAKIKDKDIEARGLGKGESTDEEMLAVLQKMIKERQESGEIYATNNRPELAEQETAEAKVIASFLPAQLSDAEMAEAIAAEIAATGAAGMKDMGKVIAGLRAKFAGKMDFGKASGIVKAKLSG